MNAFRTWLGLALCALFFLVWFSLQVVEGKIAGFDYRIREAIHRHSAPALTIVLQVITIIGAPEVLWPLVFVALLLFWRAGSRHQAVRLGISMLGAIVLEIGLKLGFHRARPAAFFDFAEPASYSYPSGHAVYALCFYAVLASLVVHYVRKRVNRALIWIAAVLLIALIGFSRVYLGVHYPSDVIAGYATALMWTGVVTAGFHFHRRRT